MPYGEGAVYHGKYIRFTVKITHGEDAVYTDGKYIIWVKIHTPQEKDRNTRAHP